MPAIDLRRPDAALSFLYKLVNFKIDCPFLLDKLNIVPIQSACAVSTSYLKIPKTNTLNRLLINTMSSAYKNISDEWYYDNSKLNYF